jgi:hypothetical protein
VAGVVEHPSEPGRATERQSHDSHHQRVEHRDERPPAPRGCLTEPGEYQDQADEQGEGDDGDDDRPEVQRPDRLPDGLVVGRDRQRRQRVQREPEPRGAAIARRPDLFAVQSDHGSRDLVITLGSDDLPLEPGECDHRLRLDAGGQEVDLYRRSTGELATADPDAEAPGPVVGNLVPELPPRVGPTDKSAVHRDRGVRHRVVLDPRLERDLRPGVGFADDPDPDVPLDVDDFGGVVSERRRARAGCLGHGGSRSLTGRGRTGRTERCRHLRCEDGRERVTVRQRRRPVVDFAVTGGRFTGDHPRHRRGHDQFALVGDLATDPTVFVGEPDRFAVEVHAGVLDRRVVTFHPDRDRPARLRVADDRHLTERLAESVGIVRVVPCDLA